MVAIVVDKRYKICYELFSGQKCCVIGKFLFKSCDFVGLKIELCRRFKRLAICFVWKHHIEYIYCKRVSFCHTVEQVLVMSLIRAINQMKSRLFHYCNMVVNIDHLSFFRWRFQKAAIILNAGFWICKSEWRLNDLNAGRKNETKQ